MAEKTEFSTIDEYISRYPADRRKILQKLRAVIKEAAPGAEERVSWQMPTFRLKKNIAHFAVHKNHIGFYPGSEAVVAFEKQLEGYKTSKGGIQFPLDKPIPYALVREIVTYNINHL